MSADSDARSARLGVVIVGAGTGTRLGGVDKAFLSLNGAPMLSYSVAAFEAHDTVDAIVLVVSAARIRETHDLVRRNGWRKVVAVVAGGTTRQQSVEHGLQSLPTVALVAIHDAARPLVSQAVISRGVEAARRFGAGVAAIPVRDTLKRVGADGVTVASTVDRADLWAAQTPQVFRLERLRAAYEAVGDRAHVFTDDAGIVEAAGFPVVVFTGEQSLMKVTHADDLEVVEATMCSRGTPANASLTEQSSLRVGTGYDIHRLEIGKPLVLGGVHVPHEVGCVGHSDGDALAHAVIDALLGASGLGDIGRHFPSGEDRFRGADSIQLLRTAVERIRGAGFVPLNIDATVVIERPRLASFVDQMATRIATAAGIGRSKVSVKAKSNEGLGAVGRGEAVAVHAVASVEHALAYR